GAVLNAQTLNDGTSADLVRLANANGTGTAQTALTVEDGELRAHQEGEVFLIPLRTAWHTSHSTFSPEYAISADFRPAADNPERRGGVMGWLDVAQDARRGIALFVSPGPETFFRVAVVDFLAEDTDSNETPQGLFKTDGTAAVFENGSAQTAAADYEAATSATFSLEFVEPTTADLAALGDATARIRATVTQGEANAPAGETIELLTNLPRPAAHRVGYFAYYGGLFAFLPTDIGYLDNLELAQDTSPDLPLLSIVRDGTDVTISWPTGVAGYQLEAATTLVDPAWETVQAANNTATLEATGETRFFRLRSGSP
ncbi:MAG TPA: hypothetical protein VMS21_02240, partial [Methylomirabilota bacterium]|nr:hypothetical protein [Methylomirabilota bacterium]